MKQQKKGQGKTKHEPEKRSGDAADVDASLVEQASLGNAALIAGMGAGAEEAFGVELDVRDMAMPKVGRAVLAMEMLPRPSAQSARMLAIIDGSKLPADRKAALTERLERDIDAAEAISAAIESAFGEDTRDLRGELVESLEAVWSGLQGGTMDGELWKRSDGSTLEIEGGSGPERADAVISALGNEVASSGLTERSEGKPGPSLNRLVSAVSLALMLDEEEEEELGQGGADRDLSEDL